MNGATEATLADLLATAQAMNVNLIKLQQLAKASAGAGGISPGVAGGASTSLSAVGVAANVAGAAFTAVQVAATAVGTVLGVMGGIVSGLVRTFTNTADSLLSFAASTALGTSTLSGFYAAFRDIPIIGRAFGVMSDVLAYQEQLLDFFQQMSVQGAGFSGSLSDMRAAASRSFMSMQDFSEVVRENTEVFSNLGGTAMSGVNRFVDIQNKMLGPRSEYGNIMAGLGLTAKGTGDMIAYYMKLHSSSSSLSLQTNEQIIKGTIAYAKELDTLSQLTGLNNKDLQKKVEKIQSEEAFENYKRDKSAAQIEYMDTVIKNTVATMGEDAAMQVRSAFMGANIVQTEGQQALAVMTQNGVTEFAAQVVRMRDQGIKAEVAGDFTRKKGIDLFNRYSQSVDRLGLTAAAITGDILLTSGRTLQQYGKSQSDLSKLDSNQRAILERQNKARQSEAQALERAEQAIRDFGNGLLMTVWGAIAPMAPLLKQFASWIAECVVSVAQFVSEFTKSDGFKAAVRDISAWFKTTYADLKKAYDEGGFSGMFKTLGAKIAKGVGDFAEFLQPIFKELEPWFKKFFDFMFSSINDYVYFKTHGVVGMTPEGVYNGKISDEANRKATDTFVKSGMRIKDNEGNYTEAFLKMRWYYDKEIAELKEAATRNQSTPKPKEVRHSGTKGATGTWWEPKTVTATIAEDEGVFTQPQAMEFATQTALAQHLEQLNNMMALQVRYSKETAEYAKRNVDATNNLDGNQFARA